MLRLCACLISIAALTHCANDNSECEQTVPPSPEATVSYLETKRAFCEYLERCEPEWLGSYVGGDVASCIEVEECPSFGFAGWTVTPACIAAVEGASCDDDGWQLINQPVCTVAGPLPAAQLGEACAVPVCRGDGLPRTFVRCDLGLFCGRDDVCEAAVAESERCTISTAPGAKLDPCELGTHCLFDDGSENQGRCTRDLATGEACAIRPGVTDIDPCEDGSLCQDGACTEIPNVYPRAALGESCAELDCLSGLICIDEVCEVRTCPAAEGDRCDPFDSGCNPDLVCNERTNVCEPIGPACDPDLSSCPAGTFCDFLSLTCQTL